MEKKQPHELLKSLKVIELDIFPQEMIFISNFDYPEKVRHRELEIIIHSQSRSFSTSRVVRVGEDILKPGTIGLGRSIVHELHVKPGDIVHITFERREPPESYQAIRDRFLYKKTLNDDQIAKIVNDVAKRRLSPLEMSMFIASMVHGEWSVREIEQLARSIAESGKILRFPNEMVFDKHSLGGVPGNKVSMLIVPIVAANGLLIPKTSSRAITSAAGTADIMESTGARVSFAPEEILEIAPKTRGMIIWAGALDICPADSVLISEVEYPLNINPKPMIMASILSKKIAMGVRMLVIDIPCGKGVKIANDEEAESFAHSIKQIGRKLKINIKCGISYANKPVGHAIGPQLEAWEAFRALETPNDLSVSRSLIEKASSLAGMLLEMGGKAPPGQGHDLALKTLTSGRALEKMQEIVEAQGGPSGLRAKDLELSSHSVDIPAPRDGWIVEMDNRTLVEIARTAGAPYDKEAGILFFKKSESVRRGEPLLRIYSSSESNLTEAVEKFHQLHPIVIEGMIRRVI